MLPWMATGAVPVRIRTATHFSLENSHRETSHRGRTFRSPWAFVGSMATLRYEPCTQFINVSQRALHIYWQFFAMSHAIHKIVSKNAANLTSYRGVRRIRKSKDSDLCASAHRCPHYAYVRLIARVNSQFTQQKQYSNKWVVHHTAVQYHMQDKYLPDPHAMPLPHPLPHHSHNIR